MTMDWVNTLVTALVALASAGLGGWFVLVAAKRSLIAGSAEAAEQRASDRAEAELQYRRQLLSMSSDRLLDALWTKERELCDALHLCRLAAAAGDEVSVDDPGLQTLGRLDLAVNLDMIKSLPFIHDPELQERMRSAAKMVNDCYAIRGGSTPDTPHGGDVGMFERAMVEVQAYFKWLRWNLSCALRGEPLPPPVDVPNVRRPPNEGGLFFPAPNVPPWT